jgi:hypothetical protein
MAGEQDTAVIEGAERWREIHPNALKFLLLVYDDDDDTVELMRSLSQEQASAVIGWLNLEFISSRMHRKDVTDISDTVIRFTSGEPLVDIIPGSNRHDSTGIWTKILEAADCLRNNELADRVDLTELFERGIADHERGEVLPGCFAPGVTAQTIPSVFETWLENRNKHRQTLFGNTAVRSVLSGEPLISGDDLSLAPMTLRASLRPPHDSSRKMVTKNIAAVLEAHDAIAHNEEPCEALFGFIRPERDLARVTSIVEEILWTWHYVSERHTGQSPFANLSSRFIEAISFERTDVQLVVETAAAVAEVLQAGYPSGKNGSEYQAKIARLIAKRGPDWMVQWIRGDIIRRHCEQLGISAESWLTPLSKQVLIDVAINYAGQDPLAVVERIINHYETTLSAENLRYLTGLSASDTDAHFTPTTRLTLARINANKTPEQLEETVREIIKSLQSTLSIEGLSKRYNWTLARTAAVFTPGKLIKAVIDSPKHPFKTLDRLARHLNSSATDISTIAQLLGWSQQEAAQLFTRSYIKELAHRYDDIEVEIRRVADNYTHVLATSNLVAQLASLHVAEREVLLVFPESIRKRLAKRVDPIDGAQDIVRTFRFLTRQRGLQPKLAAKIAGYRSISGARKLADLIDDAQSQRPRGVSELLWAWVIADMPNAVGRQWSKKVADFLSAHSLPIPIDSGAGYNLLDRTRSVGDTASEPSVILLPSDELDHLRALAEEAGVNEAELQALLDQIGH